MDKASSSLPKIMPISEDHICSCVGFRRIDTLKNNNKDLYQPTVHLDTTPVDAVLDEGDLATMHKKDRNTTPVPRPRSFGDAMHMDIVLALMWR